MQHIADIEQARGLMQPPGFAPKPRLHRLLVNTRPLLAPCCFLGAGLLSM